MISIIYENSDFLAINKPAGMLTHPSQINADHNADQRRKTTHYSLQTTHIATVVDWLLKNYPEVRNIGDNPTERPGIVHRLDKDTSGVLLIAKNQKMFEFLKKLFQEHKIKKTYIALVHGKMQNRGMIEIPIGLQNGSIKHSVRGKNLRMTKEAITEYHTIKTFEYNNEFFTLVKLMPRTGRTHQLRVHCAAKGNPIVGDMLYGKKLNPWSLKRQFLHAESVEFNLETGKRIKIEADMPDELQLILSTLENKQGVFKNTP